MTPQQDQQTGSLRTIALSALQVAEGFNPRADVAGSGIDELARSIERRGLIVPVVVAPAGEGEYRLVDGERRVRAAAKLGLVEIPAVVRQTDERTLGLEDAVVANPARSALNPLEEAQAFQRLIDAGLTRRGVAQELGLAQRLVTDRLAMLELPEELWSASPTGGSPHQRSRRCASSGRSIPSCRRSSPGGSSTSPKIPGRRRRRGTRSRSDHSPWRSDTARTTISPRASTRCPAPTRSSASGSATWGRGRSPSSRGSGSRATTSRSASARKRSSPRSSSARVTPTGSGSV